MSLRGRPGSGHHPYAAAANGYQQFTPEPMPAQQQPGSQTGYTVPVPVSVYTEHTAYQVSWLCIARLLAMRSQYMRLFCQCCEPLMAWGAITI